MMLKSPDPDAGRGSAIEAIATARRRRAPRFVIVNESAQIIMTSGDPPETEAEMTFSPALTAQLIAEIKAENKTEVFALLSPTTVLRATPLTGNCGGSFFALFVEYVESRDLLANASENYGLSLREIDVLRLVLHGMTTVEIAHRLCIAATTVHAHVKNIARKTKSTKRTEILAKLLGVR